MSTCISSYGEYSGHTYDSDDDIYCARCGVGDADRLIAVTRRQVAEQIAQAIEDRADGSNDDYTDAISDAARIARRAGDPS